MTASNAEELRRILLEVIKTHEVQLGRRDDYGQRYTLDFVLEWGDRNATIRSGWISNMTQILQDWQPATLCKSRRFI